MSFSGFSGLAMTLTNLTRANEISSSFMAHRQFPENIFVGTGPRKEALRLAFEAKAKE